MNIANKLFSISQHKIIERAPDYKFTNAGKTGNQGPSLAQCRTSYKTDWSLDVNRFNVVGGVQIWTVPSSGYYKITVRGASGGSRSGAVGKGATISSRVALVSGQKLKIIVGQMGTIANNFDCSGGGGTFVATETNKAILVAGGGGGANSNSYYGDASLTTSGMAGYGSYTDNGYGAPGVNGYGGSYNSATGQGGAGFLGDGIVHIAWSPTIPQSFINGGLGGVNNYAGGVGAVGGFGGGGGANRGLSWGSLSGGGGYSGGGATYVIGNHSTLGLGSGGGGGSFISGALISAVVDNIGHGSVEITKL